jgi:PAS domain S-box-containing protein
MNSEELGYKELLQQYRELQLRVTRFSATEQALINTRDHLDQELELYKRMQRYNAAMLAQDSMEDFFRWVCEGIVDVFELESSIVGHWIQEQNSWCFYTEGVEIKENANWIEDAESLKRLFNVNESQLLKLDTFAFLNQFKDFFEGLLFHHIDPKTGDRLMYIGLISKAQSSQYQAISDRYCTIFNVFIQNVQTVYFNHQRNIEIQEQLKLIQRSSAELRKLSLIATKTKNGVIITDSWGRVEWVNEAFTKISGYSLSEIQGLKPKDFLQGNQTDDESRKILSDALWQKQDVETTVVNYDKSGNPYYNQLEIISVFDDNGKHVNFIALQKDITQEIKSNLEMRKLNSRFALITNHSKIGLWEWTAETDTVEWSAELFHLHGISPAIQEDLREVWLKSIAPQDQARILENVARLQKGETNVIKDVYGITRGDNSESRMIETLTIAEKSEQGKVIRMVGSSKDITEELQVIKERDLSLERVKEMQSFYENILQHSPVDIVVLDGSGRMIFRNHLFSNNEIWAELPKIQDISQWKTDLDIPGASLINAIHRAVEEKTMVQWEMENLSSNQSYLYNILPYFNEALELDSVILSGVEITELKRAQDSMIAANSELRKINLELDNFVYSISHDLRSPLLSIKGIIALVLHDQGLPEKAVQFLNMADLSVTRLDGTIQEILEYSRNSRLDVLPDWFDVSSLVQSIFDDIKFVTEDTLELNLHFFPSHMLYNDKARISVLLKNIIGNSIKYRKPNNNTVIRVSLDQNETEVKIEIQDNGQGISESHLPKIFNMFYRGTSSSIGTGLGLYICNEIVMKLNGQIFVDSKLDEGTKMTILLPQIKPE